MRLTSADLCRGARAGLQHSILELRTNLHEVWYCRITEENPTRPSSGWKWLLLLLHLRIYEDTMLNRRWPQDKWTWNFIVYSVFIVSSMWKQELLVGTFNQEEALVGAFSVIIDYKPSWGPSFQARRFSLVFSWPKIWLETRLNYSSRWIPGLLHHYDYSRY